MSAKLSGFWLFFDDVSVGLNDGSESFFIKNSMSIEEMVNRFIT